LSRWSRLDNHRTRRKNHRSADRDQLRREGIDTIDTIDTKATRISIRSSSKKIDAQRGSEFLTHALKMRSTAAARRRPLHTGDTGAPTPTAIDTTPTSSLTTS
jgi:hypothetical protein